VEISTILATNMIPCLKTYAASLGAGLSMDLMHCYRRAFPELLMTYHNTDYVEMGQWSPHRTPLDAAGEPSPASCIQCYHSRFLFPWQTNSLNGNVPPNVVCYTGFSQKSRTYMDHVRAFGDFLSILYFAQETLLARHVGIIHTVIFLLKSIVHAQFVKE
jgi:hypothetical protein